MFHLGDARMRGLRSGRIEVETMSREIWWCVEVFISRIAGSLWTTLQFTSDVASAKRDGY